MPVAAAGDLVLGRQLGQRAPGLLPVAGDDEQAVVDRQPQPQHREDADHGGVDVHEVGEAEQAGQGAGHRRHRPDDGDARGQEAAEHEDHDRQGQRQGDELAALEVLLDLAGDGLDHLVDAAHLAPGARDLLADVGHQGAEAAHDLLGVRLRQVPVRDDDHRHRVAPGGDVGLAARVLGAEGVRVQDRLDAVRPGQVVGRRDDEVGEGGVGRVEVLEQGRHRLPGLRRVVEQVERGLRLAGDLGVAGDEPVEQRLVAEGAVGQGEAAGREQQPGHHRDPRVVPDQPTESSQHTDRLAAVDAAADPDLPLAVRMRPSRVEELLGQQHLLAPGSPLRRLVEARPGASRVGPSSVVLWGPPGVGKTSIAHLVASVPGRRYRELSAVTAGVKDVRAVLDDARHARDGLEQAETVLFLDEIHRFSRSQQDALLPAVENRVVTLVAATTENPSFSVVSPLLSRSLVLTLRPLSDDDVEGLVDRAVTDPRGLGGAVRLEDEARAHLVRLAGGDARRALTILEAAAGAALARTDGTDQTGGDGRAPVLLTLADAEAAVDVAAVRYDREGDQHYDVASALIKSVRGSDVDAALHYLARMLEAGEDPRFVARRLMISASEDVGMADPSALLTAVAAAQSVALIGMPEARIVLAQAVVHLATAPKSNAAYLAVDAAIADVRSGRGGQVPAHLRDAHYAGAGRLGHGQGYRYAHDEPHGVAEQQYLPDDLADRVYYRPTDRGAESRLGERLQRLRALLGRHPSR